MVLAPSETCVPTNERLSTHTTVALGGPVADWRPVRSLNDVRDALHASRGRPLLVLGGGSNLVCADAGFPGTVLAMQMRGVSLGYAVPKPLDIELSSSPLTCPNVDLDTEYPAELDRLTPGQDVWLHVAAGEIWDEVVEAACRWGLAGIECLSGIPGKAGATPIQNVGAYGQELSDTLWSVSCVDRISGELVCFGAADCHLGYRHSRFKAESKDQYVVVEVVLKLRFGGEPTLTYAELARQFEDQLSPSLTAVRRAVLATRRAKSLVFDRSDANTRNCGSFFINPVLDHAHYARLQDEFSAAVPGYPVGHAGVKVPAAWLIERAGFVKGERHGRVGLSTKHTLCLVAHDGATSRDLVDFARHIRDRVQARFGVELVPEPVFVELDW